MFFACISGVLLCSLAHLLRVPEHALELLLLQVPNQSVLLDQFRLEVLYLGLERSNVCNLLLVFGQLCLESVLSLGLLSEFFDIGLELLVLFAEILVFFD